MDKYLTIILIFMVVGIPIAWISPMTGEMRDPTALCTILWFYRRYYFHSFLWWLQR